MINAAYIKKLYNVTLVTGFNYFPFKFDMQEKVNRFVDGVNAMVVPIGLVMGFPVFLLRIVVEKEKKLIEIIKINGFQMTNYWIVNYAFNLIYFWFTMIFYIMMGIYVFDMTAFSKTNIWL